MIMQYGADAVRLFILSDSPPEKDVQWSEQGMLASYKFIQKLFLLNNKIKNIAKKQSEDNSLELSKFINQYLNKVEKNLSNFHYNVIIANIYEAYSFFNQLCKKEQAYSNLLQDYSKFLISLTPVIPHLSNEFLYELNHEDFSWPQIDEQFLVEENVNIVVQFNGKKRGIFNTKKDVPEKELINQILNSKIFEKFLKENKINKHFYVKNRLINFLI
tara:strand:- start:893 stop:1540 length:648 start_codon:yes stop_codon:yes gene_type:complete